MWLHPDFVPTDAESKLWFKSEVVLLQLLCMVDLESRLLVVLT